MLKLTEEEQRMLLKDPYAIRLLMTYEDVRFVEAAAVLGSEAGDWPTARWTELREHGRAIIAEDPEIWNPELLKEFGMEVEVPKRILSSGYIQLVGGPKPKTLEWEDSKPAQAPQHLQVGDLTTPANRLATLIAEGLGLKHKAMDDLAAVVMQAPQKNPDIVPGVMRCAKCSFRLNRINLNVNVGTVTAGDNKTEPCPNGCGPLWPVTWEQEARDAYALYEKMVLASVEEPIGIVRCNAEGISHVEWHPVEALHLEDGELLYTRPKKT